MSKPDPPFVQAILARESDTEWINATMDHPPVPPEGSRLAVTFTITHVDGTVEETVFHNVRVNPAAGDAMAADIVPAEPDRRPASAVLAPPSQESPPRFRLLILGRLLPSEDEDGGGETHRTIVIRPKGEEMTRG